MTLLAVVLFPMGAYADPSILGIEDGNNLSIYYGTDMYGGKPLIECNVNSKSSVELLSTMQEYQGSYNNFFHGFWALENITGLENLRTSVCSDFSGMFSDCRSLKSLDLSGIYSYVLEDASYMFYGCESLTNLKLGNLYGDANKNLSNMFNGCSALTSLDLSNLSTTNCTSMANMFAGCDSLTSLDISSFDTSKCNDLRIEAPKLTSLSLGSKFSLNLKTVGLRTDVNWRSLLDQKVYSAATIPTRVAAVYIATTDPVTPTPTPGPAPITKVTMHRLYNPNSGEHFYTASDNEKNTLARIGWNYEGLGWVAPKTSSKPVYRLYNENAGDHHYTMNKGERDALVAVGWKYEGVGWYSADANGAPLYRQYNPNAQAGSHNYTLSMGENNALVALGWVAEGIGWYGVK